MDPGATHGWDKDKASDEQDRQMVRLAALQDRLWAESRQAVLVILQGIDAAGKDGTINKVMEAFNPQGCPVTSFKVPSANELARDYLWRVHRSVPRKGEIGIFNRSHYEDVLVVRVHDLVPRRIWSRRFDQINDFERMLSDTGTTVVKFFLSIDREEQRERFQARYDDPTKRWKFSMGDLEERRYWDDYQEAFDDALSRTSTDHAPWYVVPANRKWFRNLAVASILADTMAELKPRYPAVSPDVPDDLVIE
jgi:PPK2 family polyphosphate:nucleotide phosphotransferase